MARWVLSLILCLGLVGCGGTTPSAIPTRQVAISSSSPANITSPTPAVIPGTPTRTPTLTPSPTPRPTPRPQTPVPVPPKPTDVEFDEQKSLSTAASSTEITQTVRWGAPLSADVEIQVYGVTECIAMPDDAGPDTGGPCLVRGTPLPASVRTLLASAPASEGSVSWTWTGSFECGDPYPAYDPEGPTYHSIVLAAYNSSGHSTFAIAEPGAWREPDPNEITC